MWFTLTAMSTSKDSILLVKASFPCINGWRKTSSGRFKCFGPETNMLKNRNSYSIQNSVECCAA